MKTFGVIGISAVLVLLCPSTSGLTVELSALRPDLEYLRGYWLKNPEDYDRQGQILFHNNEVRIKYGFPFDFKTFCPSNVTDYWANETLYLENINRLVFFNSSTEMTPISSFFYKHGRFFSNSYRCSSLTPIEEDNLVVQVPPSTPHFVGEEKTVIASYISLHRLSNKIDREVSKTDGLQSKALHEFEVPKEFVVRERYNNFTCTCKVACRFVDVNLVRIIQPIPELASPWDNAGPNTSNPRLDLNSLDQRVSVSPTTDYSYIRYDTLKKKMYTPGNELLDGNWLVRSVLGNYALKEAVIRPLLVSISPKPPRQRRRPVFKIVKGLRKFGPPIRRTLKKYQDEIFLGTAGGAVGLAILADAALIAGSLLK